MKRYNNQEESESGIQQRMMSNIYSIVSNWPRTTRDESSQRPARDAYLAQLRPYLVTFGESERIQSPFLDQQADCRPSVRCRHTDILKATPSCISQGQMPRSQDRRLISSVVSGSTCRFSSDITRGFLKAVLIRGRFEDTSRGRSGMYESGVGRMGFIGSVVRDALILLKSRI